MVFFGLARKAADNVGHDTHSGMRLKARIYDCSELLHRVIPFLNTEARTITLNVMVPRPEGTHQPEKFRYSQAYTTRKQT